MMSIFEGVIAVADATAIAALKISLFAAGTSDASLFVAVGAAMAIPSCVIALFGYLHERQAAKRARLQAGQHALHSLYTQFQTDKALRRVRGYIASPALYAHLRPALTKRNAIAKNRPNQTQLTPQEYARLEDCDQFFNFMVLLRSYINQFPDFPRKYVENAFGWWLKQVLPDAGEPSLRPELTEYAIDSFPTLLDRLDDGSYWPTGVNKLKVMELPALSVKR